MSRKSSDTFFERLSTSQIAAISNPSPGRIVFNLDTSEYQFYDGTSFVKLAGISSATVPGGGAPPPTTTPTPPPTTTTTTFDPSAATGLELWLDVGDASKVTQSGGTISAVNDKTAHAHNATQATGANQPAYTASGLNSLAVASFSGTGATALSIPASTNVNNIWASGATIMAVVTPRGGGSSHKGQLLNKGRWSLEFNSDINTTGLILYDGSGFVYGFWDVQQNTQFQWNSPALVELDYSRDNTANLPTVRFNGVPLTLGIGSQPGSVLGDDSSFPLIIGNSQDGTFPFQGDLAALYVFPAGVSDADRQSMRDYASQRWAIAQSNTSTSGTGTTATTGSNAPTGSGGSQPPTSLDLSSSATPSVTAVASKGYSCVADYTFGSTAGTIKTQSALWTYFGSPYPNNNFSGVDRLNDEWQRYTSNPTGTDLTHIMDVDHLKLRAIINDRTAYDAQVARCRASTLPAGQTPDNHDWGSWQGGTGGPGGFDCGVQSGMITALRRQKYGYFEWRVQVPPSTKGGAWPACWMVDGDLAGWPPEVDVLEMAINNAPDNSFNSFHNVAVSNNSAGVAINPKTTLPGSQLDQFGSYHGGFDQSIQPQIYAVEWQPGDSRGDHFTIYVDQVMVWDGYYPWAHLDGSPAGPAYFYTNLAFGGNWPGRLGACADPTVFPVDYKVYWFRMFAK